MNNKIYKMILILLQESTYVSSTFLAEELDVSTRTIKRYMKDIPKQISKINFSIESNKNGYMISVLEAERGILIDEIEKHLQSLNNSKIEWSIFLFILSKESVTLDELSESLHYSKGIVVSKINSLKDKLLHYDVSIYSNVHGVKVYGKEENIRRVLLDYVDLFNNQHVDILEGSMNQKNIVSVIYEIVVSELSFVKKVCSEQQINLILKYIVISLFRRNYCEYIEVNEDILVYKNYVLVNNISDRILDEFQFDIGEKDKVKLSVLLGGNKFSEKKELEIRTYILYILENMNGKYSEKFTQNNKFLVDLQKHVMLSIQRLSAGVFLENPLSAIIRGKYFIAYEYATTFVNELSKFLDIKFSDDEISYIALYFQTYLEEKRDTQKYKSLIICENGVGTSSLVRLQLETRFPNLEVIDVLPKYMVEEQEFKNVDFVISTTKIQEIIPKEVIYVSPVLTDNDFNEVNKYLRTSLNSTYLEQLFSEELFFIDIELNNQKDVLDFIFNILQSVNSIDSKTCEEILNREKEMPTDLLPDIAFPHFITTQKTFFMFVKLSSPIVWGKEKITFIFFGGININEEQSKNIYPYMLKVFQKKSNVNELKSVRELNDLINILK